MTEEQKKAIAQRVARARETLDETKLLKEFHHYVGTVNRLYYACFYAATALLETRGLESSKHSGVIALLNQHFVKAGILAAEWGKFYRYLFDTRQGGDYMDFPAFTIDEIENLSLSATRFIDEIVRVIEKDVRAR